MSWYKRADKETNMRIGVIGYSAQKFDEDEALKLINKAFDKISSDHHLVISVVSGWTNLGIPAIAYREAKERMEDRWHCS